MRKNHIFILIIFISIFFLFLYAISSGGLKSGIRQREENIIIYNNIIKAINSSKADYQVLTGREGGTFTFEIDFKNGDGTESISYMLQAIGFTRISTKRIVYCNNLRGVRLLEKNEKMILEYQRKLSECIEAAVSGGKGKENSESETWQNNQLQAGKLVTNSANGKLLLDATTVKAHRWEGEVQDFEAKSRQDVTKYSSEQVQAGGITARAVEQM
ncbi:hemagglutinin repeat-containing protein [Glaesserella parasuis]|uniref:hemagglutinin repeat-containing protein n=1 Tax=Glaesserella parasuis TaxID=738 RepID=UPI003B68100D